MPYRLGFRYRGFHNFLRHRVRESMFSTRRGGRIPRGRRRWDTGAFVSWMDSALARELRRHESLAHLLKDADTAIQCTYFSKSPARNWLVSLHQDLSIPVKEHLPESSCSAWSRKEGAWFCQPPVELLSRLIAIRVHLDHSTAENGPLRVVPRSHRLALSAQDAVEHRRRLGE